MSSLIEDTETIERYIKSCSNKSHLTTCERLISLLAKKYRRHFFIDIQIKILNIEMNEAKFQMRHIPANLQIQQGL